jgi:two-component sensor histidine kinase
MQTFSPQRSIVWNRQQELEEGMKRQQFLFNELQHRVNNMLTTIRAVARRTRAHSANLDQFTRALGDRLSALARIHFHGFEDATPEPSPREFGEEPLHRIEP